MLLDTLLLDGHLALVSLQESVVEGVGKMQLGFLILIETLVGLAGVLIFGRVSLAFVLGRMVTQCQRQKQLFEQLRIAAVALLKELHGIRILKGRVKAYLIR